MKVVIIGAGPAGLTAAVELVRKSGAEVWVLESEEQVGGISKTIKFKGNRMDIGGHRFFSKSDTVMNWWNEIMPIQSLESIEFITYQSKSRPVKVENPERKDSDSVMLVRERLSRIFFLRTFFHYPLKLNFETLRKLGVVRAIRILISYIKSRFSPIKNEVSLEDFLINRFGKELFSTFFKDYTEKVWGVPCNEISAEWGAQRIKKLSISKAVWHAIRQTLNPVKNDIHQKSVETSLIEKFLYPKFGPGQLWDLVAQEFVDRGGTLVMNAKAKQIKLIGNVCHSVVYEKEGVDKELKADFVISTMPIKDLYRAFTGSPIPPNIFNLSQGLQYRDFITVGVLISNFSILNKDGSKATKLKDNWIYIQERDVRVGRLQIFNNWSPHMVQNPETIWLGMEYFCNEGDDLWNMDDSQMQNFAISELEKIGLIEKKNVIDSHSVKVPKTYPAYFGVYDQFDTLKEHLNAISNLFLIGRNGMHKYNNQDHSMLTAMEAVSNILSGRTDKENIWAVNTEDEYHEEK